MFKQTCRGCKGPLVPALIASASALIFLSLADTLFRTDRDTPLMLVLLLCGFGGVLWLIYRYSFFTYEYMLVGGELIIRRMRKGDCEIKLTVPKGNFVGMTKAGKCLPLCFWLLPVKNHCATLAGLLLHRSVLVYRDTDGALRRLYFEPSPELQETIQTHLYPHKAGCQ